MRGNSPHGNQETPKASISPDAHKADGGVERSGKALGRTPGMHAFGQSDGSIVPQKQANKADPSAAEPVEGRGPTHGNDLHTGHVPDTAPQKRGRGLQGVREAAKRDKTMRFTALLHHVTVDLLRSSYYELKRSAAPGVDGVTWHEYGHGLELHPHKTRLIEFGRFAAQRRAERGAGKPQTFDFLGFTHCCGKTRQGDNITATVYWPHALSTLANSLELTGADGMLVRGSSDTV